MASCWTALSYWCCCCEAVRGAWCRSWCATQGVWLHWCNRYLPSDWLEWFGVKVGDRVILSPTLDWDHPLFRDSWGPPPWRGAVTTSGTLHKSQRLKINPDHTSEPSSVDVVNKWWGLSLLKPPLSHSEYSVLLLHAVSQRLQRLTSKGVLIVPDSPCLAHVSQSVPMELGEDVQLFAQPRKKSKKRQNRQAEDVTATHQNKKSKQEPGSSLQQQQQRSVQLDQNPDAQAAYDSSNPAETSGSADATFHDLGVSDWLCSVLNSLGTSVCSGASAGVVLLLSPWGFQQQDRKLEYQVVRASIMNYTPPSPPIPLAAPGNHVAIKSAIAIASSSCKHPVCRTCSSDRCQVHPCIWHALLTTTITHHPLHAQASSTPPKSRPGVSRLSYQGATSSALHRQAAAKQRPLHCPSCSSWQKTPLGCMPWC